MNAETIAIRFGYGLPAGAVDANGLLAGLAGPDHAVASWPGVTREAVVSVLTAYRKAHKAGDTVTAKTLQREALDLAFTGARVVFARAVGSDDPLRERLVAFWTDHFTVSAKNPQQRLLTGLLIDEAIRPHVTGRFADTLRAVTTHPAMLVYLNQEASVGPGSRKGKKQKKRLN